MNPNAIYSKSGKGVQEASGKTSLLSRPDRAVLSAIDGRATLADVAQKVGKTFDPAFEKLIETLDKGGFIRQLSAGTASAKPAAGGKPAAKGAATAPMDAASDLDFTAALSAPKGKASVPPPQAPPKAAPPPPKQTATIPPPPPPPTAAEKAKAAQVAKEQQDAFTKAREEAERKAAAERERVKAEAEAKLRAEQETKLRAEAEAKAKADAEKRLAAEAEAKIRAAAEAKAKAEAEAKRAREEAERARREAEEKARREQEELKRKLEEERKAREEAERKAKEEARRLEEERKKLEEERRRVEEERKREEAERAARKKQQEEEEARERAEREARRKAEAEEQAAAAAAQAAASAKAKETQAPKAPGGFSDSLLADLDSFTNQEENEAKAKAEADAKAKAEAERRAREEAERREKEEAERREREERAQAKQRDKEEAAARKRAEERELREREQREKERLAEEEEKRKKEAEEREKKAKQEERMVAKASQGARAGGEAPFSEEEALRRRRERQLGPSKPAAAAARERAARGGWGKPIAITLFLLIVVALGVAHIMPLPVDDYRTAAEEALGRPVKIGAARLSLLTGMPQLKFSDVVVGEMRIAEVRAYPELDAITGPHKRFSRIEIGGAKVSQDVLGQALFAKVKGDNFSVARVAAKNIELLGPLALPKGLEFDAQYDPEGMVRAASVRGPEALVAKLVRKDNAMEVEMSAASFSLPFAPEIILTKFGLKGTVTPRGLGVSEWDGQYLNGTLSGTANVRWGDTWLVDGVLTARNITAAVFAPALLSDGRGEGSGKFTMRGDPGKLAANARLDGSFTVTRGVLGTIDLSRAIQTGGKQATGRTEFNEMNGHAVYDRGALTLRNVTISAGQLNAGASADIAQSGALSGRIVADVKVSAQTLRATLNLGGTVKEPLVRN